MYRVQMEKKVSALKELIRRENLDPRKWMRQEKVREFADFMLNKEKDDNSFDHKEMCEYRRMRDQSEKRKMKRTVFQKYNGAKFSASFSC